MPPTTNSDSDDDTDYVPPAEDHDSDSSDENDEVAKPLAEVPEEDQGDKQKRRDSLWESFQASVSTPTPPQREEPPKKLVKVEKKYLFAGKHAHLGKVVEVPADSEDAHRWPLWRPEANSSTREEADVPFVTPDTPAAKPAGKRPGPRKPRTALPSLPKASQAKKITTLDKSAMDWRAHVNAESSDLKEELDANRRGGGYLEKVEFLKRVEDRRDDALEASKSSKRRKM
ncbi:bucentaur or craniofacial development-domain-containing protein [Melanogaster broomeanus]|nr:bucentaur or craniofacial development-domain-containing protein [Melanogaster broomeanus]